MAIVEALGQMVHIMTWQKLHDQLPKLLQTITGLYRKHSEPYHVTQVTMILNKIFLFKTSFTILCLKKQYKKSNGYKCLPYSFICKLDMKGKRMGLEIFLRLNFRV